MASDDDFESTTTTSRRASRTRSATRTSPESATTTRQSVEVDLPSVFPSEIASELPSEYASATPSDVLSGLSTALPSTLPSGYPNSTDGMVVLPDGAGITIGDRKYDSFLTKEAAASYRTLNSSVTGCYAQNGAMPLLLSDHAMCNLGFHCPNSTDLMPPQYCPPSFECQAARSMKGSCPEQGILEPIVCKAGYYCPPGGQNQYPCKKGTFCPVGSFEPWKCSFGAICPAESERQIVTVPFGFMIAFDVLLGIIVAIGFFISARRKRTKRNYSVVKNEKDLDADDVELIPTGDRASVATFHDQDELDSNPDFKVFMHFVARIIKTKEVGLSFDFEGLEFEPQRGKKVLKGVSGSIKSGSMWAVMGGSGAGKSTFFNVLMGKTKNTGGSIKINGHAKDLTKYKKLIGYVPQDDIVIPELTVRENILHSARVRLPMTWRDNEIQEYVDSLISCIGLSHVQHSLVGDATRPVVSGGQRKRVSIGMELAAAPMCIFLDEPTSGLDSTSASSIMRLLKAISKLGVTTITIIHQPREQIYTGFDNIMLLGNGSMIYAGPTTSTSTYFNSLGFTFPTRENPADVIMDIITGHGQQYTHDRNWATDSVGSLVDQWSSKGMRTQFLDASTPPRTASPSNSVISTPEQEEFLRLTMKKRGASWPAQAYYCCKRSITQQVRTKGSFFFEIGIGALAGGVIGLSASAAKGQLFRGLYKDSFIILSPAVDYQSVPQVGLLGGMAVGLAASAPAVRVFGEEKMIFNREAAAGHSMSAYYVGKMVSVLPRLFLSSLHYSVFMGILATPIMAWTDMFIAILLYFFCVYGLASCVGMVVKREDGPLLAVMASLIIGILGGVAPPLSKVATWKLEWLWRMSPGVWFTEAFVSQCLLPLDYLYFLKAASEATGFKLGQFSLDMGMLFVIGCVYRIIAYVLLITVQRKR
ncbi:unnamed protein product [Periconia digitata]|uniref:ABC transporter domain-containing protein n=1 Tax=Periconia digitata TaxID=1303443 RepID=A0A9W4XS85_9PLEO|nr:unnamed protein product [Periconia digitata]